MIDNPHQYPISECDYFAGVDFAAKGTVAKAVLYRKVKGEDGYEVQFIPWLGSKQIINWNWITGLVIKDRI